MDKDHMTGPASNLAAQQFVEQVFSTAVLNLQAVEQGLFTQLLCESSDPDILRRWEEATPQIAAALQLPPAS